MLLILLMYVLAAGNFTIAKAVLSYGQPIYFCAVRMLLASSILLPFVFIKTKKLPKIKKDDYFDFLLIIIVHIYLSFVLDLIALKHMTSSKGALFYNLSPFITAVFSYFFFHEKMTAKKYLGFFIGVLGFLPELFSAAPKEKLLEGFRYISWSELSMLTSVFTAAFGWIIFRRLMKKGYSPLFINGVGMAGGGILSLLSSLLFESIYWRPFPVSQSWQFYSLTLLSMLCGNIIHYNLQGKLLRRYTVTFLSFAGFITPLITAFFGWVFLGETVNWTFFFSVFAVSIGLTLFYYEELRQGYITH